MGDQDNPLLQKTEELIEKQETSVEASNEVSKFPAKEENANYLKIPDSVDQDILLREKIEEKIKKQLENSPETFVNVRKFLEKEENAHFQQILESVIDIDEVFHGLVDRLTKEMDPDTNKVSDPLDSSYRLKNANGGNFVVADCITQSENVGQSWFSMETVTRVSGKIGGALIGTALLPGVGTVVGGILGGKLSTSAFGMLSS